MYDDDVCYGAPAHDWDEPPTIPPAVNEKIGRGGAASFCQRCTQPRTVPLSTFEALFEFVGPMESYPGLSQLPRKAGLRGVFAPIQFVQGSNRTNCLSTIQFVTSLEPGVACCAGTGGSFLPALPFEVNGRHYFAIKKGTSSDLNLPEAHFRRIYDADLQDLQLDLSFKGSKKHKRFVHLKQKIFALADITGKPKKRKAGTNAVCCEKRLANHPHTALRSCPCGNRS